MAILDTMVKEHHLIRDFIDKVQVAVEVSTWGERPPVEVFEKAIDFAEQYIETFHHDREEKILFPWLIEKVGPDLSVQFDILDDQHVRSKAYLAEIKRTLELYRREIRSGTADFFTWLSSYLSFVRSHLNQENHIFFPLIESVFSEKEQVLIQRLFDDRERKLGAGFVENCNRTLAEMTDILEKNYRRRYGYLLDAVHSKRVEHQAA